MHNGEKQSKPDRISHFVTGLRRIVGMPDYQAYIDHLHRCHPGSVVPSEREFFDQFVNARYSGGPTRCC